MAGLNTELSIRVTQTGKRIKPHLVGRLVLVVEMIKPGLWTV